MTTLARRHASPLTELLSWLESDMGLGFRSSDLQSYLRIEDYIEAGAYVLRAEMPGIDPEKDVAITIDHGTLTIRAERRDEKRDRGHHEFHYGAFTRTVALPNGVKPEGVTAHYVDGVLEIRVPLDVTEPEPVSIPVQRPGE